LTGGNLGVMSEMDNMILDKYYGKNLEDSLKTRYFHREENDQKEEVKKP
jgi:hypothetical protein